MSSSTLTKTFVNGTSAANVFILGASSTDAPTTDDMKNAQALASNAQINVTSQYVWVGLKPADGAKTGSAILFNTNEAVNRYATSDAASFVFSLCDDISDDGNVSCAASGNLAKGASIPNTLFFTLATYNIVADASGPLGYIINDLVSDPKFARDTGSGLVLVSRDKKVAPKVMSKTHWWVWILSVVIMIIVIIAAIVGGVMYYKHHKSGGY